MPTRTKERRKLFAMDGPQLKVRVKAGGLGIGFAFFLLLAAFCAMATRPVFGQEITDKGITFFVETELRHEKGVSPHRIDVETKDGVVTLSGSVGNVLAEERAADIARSVRGVRAVINHLSVVPAPRNDPDILADVNHALKEDPATDTYELSVSVDNGTVTLTGTVDSWAEKRLCAQVAKGVKGVKRLENELSLKQKEIRLDSEIEADIKSRFKWDARLAHNLIDIEVKQGRVTLSGAVASAGEKLLAYRNSWVAGVQDVDFSRLKVDGLLGDQMKAHKYTALSDDRVAEAVNDAFRYDPRVAPFDIQVDVTAGVATLMGAVDNLKARKSAEQDAKNTVGVWRVRNLIKVRSTLSAPYRPAYGASRDVAERIRGALARDPYVDQDDSTVIVGSNFYGTVHLEGVVDSKFEKWRAEDVVSRMRQVVQIFNDLKVGQRWARKSDWEIEANIEDELWWNPSVDSEHIAVSVEDGVAALTGVVHNLRERRIATENAYEGGAREVQNMLKVKNGPPSLAP
jgi:osmotically-inducible protein OsmY